MGNLTKELIKVVTLGGIFYGFISGLQYVGITTRNLSTPKPLSETQRPVLRGRVVNERYNPSPRGGEYKYCFAMETEYGRKVIEIPSSAGSADTLIDMGDIIEVTFDKELDLSKSLFVAPVEWSDNIRIIPESELEATVSDPE